MMQFVEEMVEMQDALHSHFLLCVPSQKKTSVVVHVHDRATDPAPAEDHDQVDDLDQVTDPGHHDQQDILDPAIDHTLQDQVTDPILHDRAISHGHQDLQDILDQVIDPILQDQQDIPDQAIGHTLQDPATDPTLHDPVISHILHDQAISHILHDQATDPGHHDLPDILDQAMAQEQDDPAHQEDLDQVIDQELTDQDQPDINLQLKVEFKSEENTNYNPCTENVPKEWQLIIKKIVMKQDPCSSVGQ